MQQLTPQGFQAVQNIANRYNISVDSALAMLAAVNAGGGTMAQFSIPELGGGGQWMQGGMTMVGDMFNTQLQYRVANLCSDLSNLLNNQQVYLPSQPYSPGQGGYASSNQWWPADLGAPSASGGQNDSKYAVFPQTHRLAIFEGGQVRVYDTLDHQIGGVQQQSGNYLPTFSSQYGTFTVNSLPLANAPQQENYQPPISAPTYQPSPGLSNNIPAMSSDDIFRALEQLGQLQQKNIISLAEFEAKKSELLARL